MPDTDPASLSEDEVYYGQVVVAQCGVQWSKIREIFGDFTSDEWQNITCTFGPSNNERELAVYTDEYGCIGTLESRTSNALRPLLNGQEIVPKIR